MKGSSNIETATSLTLVAVGAIIAFASPPTPFLNLRGPAGCSILTGVVGAIVAPAAADCASSWW